MDSKFEAAENQAAQTYFRKDMIFVLKSELLLRIKINPIC